LEGDGVEKGLAVRQRGSPFVEVDGVARKPTRGVQFEGATWRRRKGRRTTDSGPATVGGVEVSHDRHEAGEAGRRQVRPRYSVGGGVKRV
jgi:hypothetical protein